MLLQILEYIAVVILIFYFIQRYYGGRSDIIGDGSENFQNLFMDDMNATANDLVLKNPETLTIYNIGTAASDTYPIEFAKFMRHHIYPVELIPSTGSMYNINAMLEGIQDISLVDEDILISALHPDRKFRELSGLDGEELLADEITGIAVLYSQPMLLISAQGRLVSSWEDIANRKVGIPGRGSNSYYHFMKLVNISNLPNSVNIVIYEDQNQMLADFETGNLDAIFLTTNQKNKGLLDLAKRIKLRFISPVANINPDLIKKQFMLSVPYIVDLNSFYNNINTIGYLKTIASRMLLVCHRSCDYSEINYLTKNLIKNLKPLQQNINHYVYQATLNNAVADAFEFNSLASMDKTIKIHEGAKDVYIENGLILIV